MQTYQPKFSPHRTRSNMRQFLRDAEIANEFLHAPNLVDRSQDSTNINLQKKTLLDMSAEELQQYFTS